jgi:hypothetical protein
MEFSIQAAFPCEGVTSIPNHIISDSDLRAFVIKANVRYCFLCEVQKFIWRLSFTFPMFGISILEKLYVS